MATRLISAVEFSPVSPSIPRKISGATSSLSDVKGDGDAVAVGVSAAALFFASTAARWLTRDAAKATLATFLGCARVAFAPLLPAVAISAAFTALGAADVAGWAATSAKDLLAGEELEPRAGTFTAVVAGSAACVGGEWRLCRRVCFHVLVLATFLSLPLLLRGLRALGSSLSSVGLHTVRKRQEKSTHATPRCLKVSSLAQMPCSTHSSNREKRRDVVRLAV